jgi:hypothetical protein
MTRRLGGEPYQPPSGVLVELPNGERVDVPYEELELIWPPHPCHAEPDASHASWLLDALGEWSWSAEGSLPVAQFVPRSLDAVARMYHPWRRDGTDQYDVPWATVAVEAGVAGRRALDALLLDSYDAVPGFSGPDEGQVVGATMRVLVEVLRAETTTPGDVLFVVWEGWGKASWERFPGAADVAVPQRDARLLRGPIEGALEPMAIPAWSEPSLPAMVWWPADRSWVVHSEIDFKWTFVAGSEALTARLVEHDGLEAVRTSFDAPANRPDDEGSRQV